MRHWIGVKLESCTVPMVERKSWRLWKVAMFDKALYFYANSGLVGSPAIGADEPVDTV